MEVSSSLLRGAARMLADNGISLVAFRGAGQGVYASEANAGRTALVELDLKLPGQLLDERHYMVVDPLKVLDALKAARSPTVSLEASGGKVLIDGQEVGEVYRVGEGPGLNPRTQAAGRAQASPEWEETAWGRLEVSPAENPREGSRRLTAEEVARLEVRKGDALRRFLSAAKDYGNDHVFLGARGGEAFVGFWAVFFHNDVSNGFAAYRGDSFEGGLRVVSSGGPAATTVYARELLRGLPSDWFKGGRSPRVQMALTAAQGRGPYDAPLLMEYDYAASGSEAAHVRYWVSPAFKRAGTSRILLDLSPRRVLGDEARSVDATYTISFEDAALVEGFHEAVGYDMAVVAGKELDFYFGLGSDELLVKLAGVRPLGLAAKPDWDYGRVYKVEGWPGSWRLLAFFDEPGVPLHFTKSAAYLWVYYAAAASAKPVEDLLAGALGPFERAGAPALRGRVDAARLRRVAEVASSLARGGGFSDAFVIFTADGRLYAAGRPGKGEWQVYEAGRWSVSERPPGAPGYGYVYPYLVKSLVPSSALGPVEVSLVPAAARPAGLRLRLAAALPAGQRDVEIYYRPQGRGPPEEVLRLVAGGREEGEAEAA